MHETISEWLKKSVDPQLLYDILRGLKALCVISYHLYICIYHDLNKISKTTSERIRVKFSQSGAPALCDNHFVIASVMLWIIFKLWKQLISLLEYSLQLCSANSCPYSPGCMATIMMMHYLLPTSTLLIYLS